MTSTRRLARGGHSDQTSGVHLDGIPVPAVLLDRDDPLWRAPDWAKRFADLTGVPPDLPVSERCGVPSHPHNRRNEAAEAWAIHNRRAVTDPKYPHAVDLHRLSALGIYG